MGIKSPGQFPNTLYWVQLRTIGRQKIQTKNLAMFPQLVLHRLAMMIAGVIQIQNHFLVLSPVLHKGFQKPLKGIPFELRRRILKQLATLPSVVTVKVGIQLSYPNRKIQGGKHGDFASEFVPF